MVEECKKKKKHAVLSPTNKKDMLPTIKKKLQENPNLKPGELASIIIKEIIKRG